MKTDLAIAAIALGTFSAQAADHKPVQIESWSFGCSNPAMATQQGGAHQARASYDLKVAKGARVAASPPSCDQGGAAPSPQAVRESPSKAVKGHVTVLK